MKKKIVIYILITFILSCIGCNTEKKQLYDKGKVYTVIEKTYDDREKAADIFFDNKNLEINEHINSDDRESKIYIVKNDKYELYILNSLYSNSSIISYGRPECENYKFMAFDGSSEYFRDEFIETFKGKKINIGISEEEVINMCYEYFEKLEVNNMKIKTIYALDKDGLNYLEHMLISDETYEGLINDGVIGDSKIRDYSDENEVYFITYEQVFDNKPVSYFSYDNEYSRMLDDNGRAYIIVDNKGIIMFEMFISYVEKYSDEVNILKKAEAKKKAEDYLYNTLYFDNYVIDEAEPIYIPIYIENSEIKLIPGWSFLSKDSKNNLLQIKVNAMTGEVID